MKPQMDATCSTTLSFPTHAFLPTSPLITHQRRASFSVPLPEGKGWGIPTSPWCRPAAPPRSPQGTVGIPWTARLGCSQGSTCRWPYCREGLWKKWEDAKRTLRTLNVQINVHVQVHMHAHTCIVHINICTEDDCTWTNSFMCTTCIHLYIQRSDTHIHAYTQYMWQGCTSQKTNY